LGIPSSLRAIFGRSSVRQILTYVRLGDWHDLGVSVAAGERLRLAGELFYTPLDVVGRAGKGEESDGLFNAHALLADRLR